MKPISYFFLFLFLSAMFSACKEEIKTPVPPAILTYTGMARHTINSSRQYPDKDTVISKTSNWEQTLILEEISPLVYEVVSYDDCNIVSGWFVISLCPGNRLTFPETLNLNFIGGNYNERKLDILFNYNMDRITITYTDTDFSATRIRDEFGSLLYSKKDTDIYTFFADLE